MASDTPSPNTHPDAGASIAPPAPAAPSRVIDYDIFCEECRYNLRGLTGDPVRCPECGHMSPLGGGEIPEATIAAQLRTLESPLAVCVGALLFAAPWQVMLWLLVADSLAAGMTMELMADGLACLIPPAFLPLPIWLAAVLGFRASCRGQPGWARLLFRYHLYGIGAGGAMVAMAVASSAMCVPIGRGLWPHEYVVLVLVFAATIVAARWLLATPHRRLMARIHELQREDAVTAIREEARRNIRSAADAGTSIAPPAPAAPSRVIDYDIFCEQCRYNLRGLTGDPVRCPECGHMNPLGEGEIPEAKIAAQLRKMERPLVVCVGAILFAVPFQLMLCAILADSPHGMDRETLGCIGIPAVVPLIAWLGCVLWFRASCRRQPGWGRLLAWYHLYGLGAAAIMGAAAIAIGVLWSPIGRGMRLPNFLVPVLVFTAAIVVIRRRLAAPHRRLMARIHELQGEYAITAIREEARRKVRLARR